MSDAVAFWILLPGACYGAYGLISKFIEVINWISNKSHNQYKSKHYK
jgi:hypothetical protein